MGSFCFSLSYGCVFFILFFITHRTAEDWVYWYSLYNSGLYNNQWMVFDYKKFTPYQPLQPGAFWIFEQIPGGGHAGDMTEWLENETYWASYNIPYFKDIYNACGYPAKVEEWEPKAMSWEEGARAQIFRRDHHKVIDLASMARIMRYNDYQHDTIIRRKSKCRDRMKPWKRKNSA